MKKLIALAAAAAGISLLAMAPAANAAGQLCYDINVEIAGQAPIAQAGCQDIPTP